MHVLDQSAALLYKTHCNQVIGLILVIIFYIYAFGLRTTLWRSSGFGTKEEIYSMYTRCLLLLRIQGKLC